ncbi:hypothetical protein [Bartonella bovis]|uniref:Uncharacterized protein n=1 Tax=Bartonella bovis m02 TaxID=1094492 RepID=N6VIM2_9HYPH|nr:hypothetical protein [Bartonella bovis]ENN89963.1 hypothetical protein m02_11560 [Bartonella bovis m02]ENN93232.1 hypothetical protein m02_02380 [Bartonella bovis m02]ENN93710.1 hypothetical protein m02_07250 [Bartonella bovis m02]
MNKQVFVGADEILLIVSTYDEYDAKPGPLDETEIMNMVNQIETVVSILRIDLMSNRYDDISEEVAELYVQKYLDDYEHYYFVEDAPYPFIAHSCAYSDVLDKMEEREDQNPFYSTYQQ